MKTKNKLAASAGRMPDLVLPLPVTMGEAEAAIALSKRVMQEEMDQYIYAHKKMTESGMLKEAAASLRKGLARKQALKILARMVEELKSTTTPKSSPAFTRENSVIERTVP